jgi:hypothetical protein
MVGRKRLLFSPLSIRHPSSDDTAAVPAASTIADSAVAFTSAALPIGSRATLAIGSAFAGGAPAIGSALAICHSGDKQHTAVITWVAADAYAHYRRSVAGCAPCYQTAYATSLARGIRFFCGP